MKWKLMDVMQYLVQYIVADKPFYQIFTQNNAETRIHRVKYKSKNNPAQAWTGSEGSRRLNLPDFKTFAT
jgi:hypothetical protein